MSALLDDAQWQQVKRIDALEKQGIPIGGWKLGLTSGQSRDAFGAGFRPFGFVRRDRILDSGALLRWSQVHPGGIETEVCFTLMQDLEGVIDANQVRERVTVSAGFEINQTRLGADASPPDRIADNLSNWGIVLGPSIKVPSDWVPDALVVSMRHEDQTINTLRAEGHIDDHFVSLATLANRLQRFGRRLSKGDHVITGAFGRVRDPAPGVWSGKFSGLGCVDLVIEP